MAATYDPDTDRGKVRLLISDVDTASATFTDEEIDTFLTMGDSVRDSAAVALETIAGNQALVLKRIKTHNLETNGPELAKELRALATQLRDTDDQAGVFLIADQSTSASYFPY